jgi:exodeoxyribonuclease VII large subunit
VSQPSLDLELEDDPADPTFSVRELAAGIDAALQRGFRDGVWVRGEVQGLQERANGHLYFNLTEDGEEGRATLAVVLFGGTHRRLAPMLRRHRLRVENGIAVRIHGRLEFYGPTGRVSLVMDGLDPRFSLGQLSAQRDQLLRLLVAEGLLDRNRRLRMPLAPLRVGVVASRDSAAWHDFRAELRRSGLAFRARVVDVRVQGEGAELGVAAAIERLGIEPVDVIVVIRGGGARTELATFDTEVIARAIAASPLPVLTGLGHEIDRSVADEVAHTALKTPTACAGALIERVEAYRVEVERCWEAIVRQARAGALRADHGLGATTRRIAHRTTAAVDLAGQRLDHRAARLQREAGLVLAGAGAHLDASTRRMAIAGSAATAAADRRLEVAAARSRAFDPERTLARGWSITRRADGSLLRAAGEAEPGEVLVTTVVDGAVRSRVERVEEAR